MPGPRCCPSVPRARPPHRARASPPQYLTMHAMGKSIRQQIMAQQLVHQPMTTTIAGVSRRRKFLVLGICCMSLFIVSMDTTIINVALPAISKDLGAPISGLQWTIDAYVVVLASFLLLSGS